MRCLRFTDSAHQGRPTSQLWRAALQRAAVGAAVLGLAGCSLLPQAAPQTDAAFGQGVRQTLVRQVLDPTAGRDADLGSFDSQAARNALVRHRDSFKEPPPSFTVFGLGGNRQGQ